MIKSHKLNLFEFRKALSQEKDLSVEKVDVINILTEHINAYGEYSEIEIKNSLTAQLESFTFLDNIKTLLSGLESDLQENKLYFTLKDLYSKIERKDNRFLYETALEALMECINQNSDEERKIKIVETLNMYEWIPEIKIFLYEMASTPQQKMNFSSQGGKINDVYSLILQVKEGYIARVHDTWFLLGETGIKGVLLEDFVSDDVERKKIHLLTQALELGTFTENSITFDLGENFNFSIDMSNGKLYLDGVAAENETTLESLFNSPVVPYMGKAYYPIINECLISRKKFVILDSVKRVNNITNNTYECFVFNFKGTIFQYRVDKFTGNNVLQYDSAHAIIENVMHELGVDITFFYENLLSEELKQKVELEKQEMKIQENIKSIEDGILAIKAESNEDKSIMEHKAIKNVYNGLLSKRHKLQEELKTVKHKKSKILSN